MDFTFFCSNAPRPVRVGKFYRKIFPWQILTRCCYTGIFLLFFANSLRYDTAKQLFLDIYEDCFEYLTSNNNKARLAQSVERKTLTVLRSNNSVTWYLKAVGSTPTSGFSFCSFVIFVEEC